MPMNDRAQRALDDFLAAVRSTQRQTDNLTFLAPMIGPAELPDTHFDSDVLDELFTISRSLRHLERIAVTAGAQR